LIAFWAFAAIASAPFCALNAASSEAFTCLTYFASSLATFVSSFSFFLRAVASALFCLASAFLRVSAS
jgi:hypothetical protein